MVLKSQNSFLRKSFTCYEKTKENILKNYHYDKASKRSMYTLDPIDPNETTFKKVLIANRGEIACRIIQTAKRMGIKTVAVYSVADSQARHVKLADEGFFIGPSPATESYLNIDRIIQAVRETNADAVHPGYGFLSENFKFVKLLESQNIAFIGPSADVISRMGDKLESKRTALAAGVNVIPGFDEIVKNVDQCVGIARGIGYPVMIKASAGGGGKGMRIARNDQEVRDGFLLSVQEAESSFGDTRILVEKYIENPRHIEIQVLGDKYENIIYLNERECSIQRRNQKVIEEAPSVFLDNTTREAMGKQSVALCKKLKYSSAGTVEFLVDQNRKFYFLEMNTRLQVEHPITECITGIDLVQQMFRVSKGHKLNLRQGDIKIGGWAMECRVYAEDPYKNFGLPNIGRLHKYREPHHIPGIRCDSGIEEGSEISMHYDPLICKLVCHANTRQEAIQKSITALDSYVIRGITHNIPLLRDILTKEKFNKGDISTNYLPQVYPEGFKGLILDERDRHKLVAVAAALFATNELRYRNFINSPKYILRGKAVEKWNLFIKLDKEKFYVYVLQTNDQFRIKVAGKEFYINKKEINVSDPLINLQNGKSSIFQLLFKSGREYQIIFHGNNYKLDILTQKAVKYLKLMPKKPNNNTSNQVKAPMSGLIKSVYCAIGDIVTEGQELCVIEAMKMQNFLSAPSNGKVGKVRIKVGDTVSEEDILVELE